MLPGHIEPFNAPGLAIESLAGVAFVATVIWAIRKYRSTGRFVKEYEKEHGFTPGFFGPAKAITMFLAIVVPIELAVFFIPALLEACPC